MMTGAAAPPLTVLYFAWLKERVGTGEEKLSPPDEVRSVGALMDWLGALSGGHAAAFAHAGLIRCAVNQEFADRSAAIKPGDEVAFFPPVTGG
jgi:molybdopterin converting factor subunit 1